MLSDHHHTDEAAPAGTRPTDDGNLRAVVFKLGGSLLDAPDLPRRIRTVLGLRRDCRPLLVVGGGAAADVVRQWDAIHKPGDETTHDLAVLAMGLNEELLLRLLPESRPVRSARQFESAAADGMLPILCAHCFLKWGESAGHPRLRRSWDVTSDSIAVWTARVIRADECVLVKSVACPQGATAAEAARRGLVDACFAETAAGLPAISWSNARDAAPAIVPWLRQGIPVA